MITLISLILSIARIKVEQKSFKDEKRALKIKRQYKISSPKEQRITKSSELDIEAV